MSLTQLLQKITRISLPRGLASSLEGMRVLLAEDCMDQQRLYYKFLKDAGADVVLECNGQAATDAARKTPDAFNAVVMDFQMPELDGLDATRGLRELGYYGPIIAITAHASSELEQAWYEAGCDSFLTKPINKQELIGAVARLASVTGAAAN